MEKKRVHQVAKEYHISSDALIAMLKDMGFDVKGYMSIVDEKMAEQIHKKFEEEKEEFRREIKRKKKRTEERTKTVVAKVSAPSDQKKKRRKKKEQVVGPSRFRNRRKSRLKRREVDQKIVEENIRKTLAQIESGVRGKKRRPKIQRQGEEVEEERNLLRVSEFTSIAELAALMGVKTSEVISKCLEMGLVVTINQRLDMDTIAMVADEFGFEVEPLGEYAEDLLEKEEEEVDEDMLQPRPPVVTIMGHVDHGKTSLLDYIRKSNIIAGEVGGITQHIGAYEVELEGGKVTFLDTPGHEAFTAMRARGAQVTDIVVLVVAADSGVMPQTVEAIDHARAAGVPIVVAINKVDLPKANPDAVKQQLADHGLLVEGWGGKTLAAEVSAKTGKGIDKLLDMLLLEAEMLELKANPHRKAKGTIIEARLDRGRGCIATVLVQDGTLGIGDPFVVGLSSGRVRALFNERGYQLKEAGPSSPVQILGIEGIPQAGDSFYVLSSEREAKLISQKRQLLKREQDHRRVKRPTLGDISQQIKEGRIKDLSLIVKADVDGSVEALSDSLMQLGNEEVTVRVIHRGVGAVAESDVLLAAASNAIIIGFNVRAEARARDLATKEQVDIRFYQIIYDAIDDVKAALSGLLAPEIQEKVIGTASVRQVFRIPKVGTIAGCYVQSGVIRRGLSVRVLRDGAVIFEGSITSLKRFKDDVKEVSTGYECGVGIEGSDDIRENDLLEVFEVTETVRELK
ncbi:MAG TPA: translation initiation factor IF-2 [Candidatus Latescibacteria bacterium]|nr:translation initiation factor IF-2 [Candidatus Latescibacterota bacterium]